MDLMLDVVVDPDMNCQWKDEDEFALLVERGLISVERSAELRAEGEIAVDQLRSKPTTLVDRWRLWRPEPSWALPSLLDEWERP